MTADPCNGNVIGGNGCKCPPPFGSDAVTLLQIVAALSVTFKDEGVRVWLTSKAPNGDGRSILDLIADGEMDHAAELVAQIGDCDPRGLTVIVGGND